MEVPWVISLEIRRIKSLIENVEVEVEHTLREGNKLADYFANLVFYFAGTRRLTYHLYRNYQEKPKV